MIRTLLIRCLKKIERTLMPAYLAHGVVLNLIKKTERQCFRTDTSKSTACGVSYHESNVKK